MPRGCKRTRLLTSGAKTGVKAHSGRSGRQLCENGEVSEDRSSPVTLESLRRSAAQITAVAERRGASSVRVFGSIARGDAGASSDVDLLVDLDPDRSLFDLGGLLMDLAELLGTDVDVVTEASLKPRVRSRVLAEAVAL